MSMRSREGWNHNSHYHDWLMRHLPRRFERGLDVGCGQGFFASRLAEVADRIDALDVDADILAEASKLHPSAGVAFHRGDFLEMKLPPDAYDVVTSIAALHHMNLVRALAEMKRILRPGGHLAILGLYHEASLVDYAVSLVAIPANLVRTHLPRNGGTAPVTAPTRNPTLSLSQIRRSVAAVLPGAQVDRHLYWRYSLLWQKPFGWAAAETPRGR